jgi:acetylornithine aminotransferase
VCRTLDDQQLWKAAERIGDRITRGLSAALEGTDGVVEIRGRGLMIGLELDRPCGELVSAALGDGLLINVTADRVVRLLPPLVISDQQADRLVSQLGSLVRSFLASH